MNNLSKKKKKDNRGDAKLTSNEQGRESIINCSSCLKDDLSEGTPNRNFVEIKYHLNTCYPLYVTRK